MTTRPKHTQGNGVGADIFREWADRLANELEELSAELDDDYTAADVLLAEYRGFMRGIEAGA